ncbi:MAG: hypothetical protein ABIQ49_14080 [Gemmatimonadales bacterium]
MLLAVKAAVGPSCLWGLIGAMGLSACRRDVERAGEPIAHLRLLVRHPGVSRLSPTEIRAVALYVVTLAAMSHSEEGR